MSIVRRTHLGKRCRLDPEYYRPDYLHLDSVLASRECQKLSAVSREINCGPFGSTVLCDTYLPEGMAVIRPFNIKDLRVDDEEIVYISKNDVSRKNLKTYTDRDIVFSRVGDIRCGVIDNFDNEVTISPNIIALKLKTKLMNPYYVCAFMNTIHGYMQLERGLKIVAQPTIGTEAVAELLIPELGDEFQVGVEKIVKLAFSELTKSKLLYSQAESLLLEELRLKDFEPKYELSYTASLSKAFGAHRIDAEYFQPASDQLIEKVSSYKNGYARLTIYAEPVRPDFDPRRYLDTSFKYVELADIDASIGVIRSASQVKGDEAPSRARRILKNGDVIVSSVEGSLEKVALVDEEHEGSLASTGFFQFRARAMQPEVLLVLARSMVLQVQLKKECAGTILTAVPNESLKRIIIPILSLGLRQDITGYVRRSHEARRKAKQLLEEAKRKVERAIDMAAGD